MIRLESSCSRSTRIMHTREEIAAALDEAFAAVAAHFESLPDAAFERGPAGKWTAGQHLDHLVRSAKPVNLAMRLPRFVLKFQFGTANRESRGYDAVVSKYRAALDAGGAASGRFLPAAPEAEDKPHLLDAYRREG